MKQTTVEWLEDKLQKAKDIYGNEFDNIIKQAIHMEKEQIENAFEQGKCNWLELSENTFEQYYNEEYGKE